MRIAAVADLHYCPQNYDKIREQMLRVRDEADVLVMAGDLTNFGQRGGDGFAADDADAAAHSHRRRAGQSRL